MKAPLPLLCGFGSWILLLISGMASAQEKKELVPVQGRISGILEWFFDHSKPSVPNPVCVGCAAAAVPTRADRAAMTWPWKKDIVTTVFWAGEKPSGRNPTPNKSSSWDPQWTRNYGGYDDPNNRRGWLPRGFTPGLNPFYIALPYNDTAQQKTKPSAPKCIPWFKAVYYRDGKSVLKSRWVAIRRNDKICFAQWEDCGPFVTDDWQYVFGTKRPLNQENGGAGLDVSPAVRDFLGFSGKTCCDWRFVELHEVSDGPWKHWGKNNPFALREDTRAAGAKSMSASN